MSRAPRRAAGVRRALGVAVGASLLSAAAAGAQAVGGAPAADPSSARSCQARIPRDSLVRVVVHLEANAGDSASRAILPSADLLVQLLRDRVHTRLGAGAGTLPAADTLLAWPDLGIHLRLTMHRDGRIGWRPPSDSAARAGGVVPTLAAATLLERAASELVTAGERVFWPDELVSDSAVVELHFHHADVLPSGQAQPMRLRVPMPLFTLPVPRLSPVVETRAPRIAYPALAERIAAAGTVVLQYVVDSTGRVEAASVRDVWPPGRPRLTGDLGRAYDAFLTAARRGVLAARYEPARLGGCATRQLVEQPFEYRFR